MTRAIGLIAVLLATLSIGCATTLPPSVPFTTVKKGESEVGTSARAYVGDVVYRKFDVKEQYEGFVTGVVKIDTALR